MNNVEKFHAVFNSFKDHFGGAFHATLWRVFVDEMLRGRVAAFTINYTDHGLELGISIANESGYIRCPVTFKNKDYDHASEIVEQLNQAVFGLNEETAFKIVSSSQC